MKKPYAPRRSRAALLIGAALVATPALAQDAAPQAQTVTPPPIMVTPAPAPAPAPQPRVQMAPSSPIVQAAPEGSVETEAAPAAPARAARAVPVRQQARSAAPARAAAAGTPTAAPVAQAPAAEAPAPQPAPVAAEQPAAPAPAAPADSATATSQTEARTENNGLMWPLVLGGLLLAALGVALAAMLSRRRRAVDEDEAVAYTEEAPRSYAEEPVVAAPVALAPETAIAAEVAPLAATMPRHEPEVTRTEPVAQAHGEAELATAADDDLANVADAPAPVSNRPWLEFGLRPVRAGTSEEEALVDVELTVGNAGDTPARDVRISTFLLADAEGSEMEQLLTERRSDAAVPPVTIAPGDGTRVDAHLAVPKGELGRTFNPVVVAEARYTLPDGREGRTSAAFRIGRPAPDAEGVGAIGATRPHMVEDVEAELFGQPEHA